MINSKRKGAAGERAWVQVLQEHGYTAKRTGFHQSQQGHDAPDVTCHDLPIHWEVKNTEKCQIRDWLSQAAGDCKEYQIPVITWKSNNREWIAILTAKDLLKLIQTCDIKALEEAIQS